MTTLTSPRTARNLTVWFVATSKGAALPDYAVMEESMEKQTALLHETGNVTQLLIENLGDFDLFCPGR